MRITEYEKQVIVEAVASFDTDAPVYLFGSRADDTKKGGDIDIAILSSKIAWKDQSALYWKIADRIGEQKIDIAVFQDENKPFYRLAKQTGLLLNDGVVH
ncbi:MAG: nucleotidyltransferase domain-containing protein [Planctomycetaceae bacterium]|jgi:predicted nucleotidyltransferase|nr:nucleotidyltransferase domain-containing protein [Planctomycetaceae bacterium]